MITGRRTAYAVASLLLAHAAHAADSVVLYPAYASGDTGVLEGRVVERQILRDLSGEDRRHHNLRRNLGLLINDEREDVAVTARFAELNWGATTDAEGYFRIELDRLGDRHPGWHRVTGEVQGASTETSLLIVPPVNVHGLISDLDDTIVVTEVNSLRRMLKNTLLRNPYQREAVPGAAALYRRLASRNVDPQAAPIFYLSASPRQLHFAIETFLGFNEFPLGVLITKRVTNDETSEPLRDQMAYKKAKIEEILARVPHTRFTLIGDDGELDPEIYRDIRDAHPDRIDAVWIRRVNPDAKRRVYDGQGDLLELLGTR